MAKTIKEEKREEKEQGGGKKKKKPPENVQPQDLVCKAWFRSVFFDQGLLSVDKKLLSSGCSF